MNGLEEILVQIGVLVILPVMIVWLFFRHRMNETNKRTQIVLAAIEKNPEMDIQELFQKMALPRKLLKEKLLSKLLWGCIISFVGLVLLGWGLYLFTEAPDKLLKEDAMSIVIPGLVLLAIGIAFFINYAVGKRMLTKEIEAEEKTLITKE